MNAGHRKLLGESIREIGVLTLVFVPLDILIELHTGIPAYPKWMSWMTWLSPQHFLTIFFAVAGVVLLSYGIVIEERASKEEKEGGNRK